MESETETKLYRNNWFLVHYKNIISMSKFDIVHRKNIVLDRDYVTRGNEVTVQYGNIRFSGTVLKISGSKGYIRRYFQKLCRKYLIKLHNTKLKDRIISRDKNIQCKLDEDCYVEIQHQKLKLENDIKLMKTDILDYQMVHIALKIRLKQLEKFEKNLDKSEQVLCFIKKHKLHFGLHRTKVATNVFINLNRSCYVSATKNLVMNIFNACKLATHSLTNPDFNEILEILYPNEVSDIIEVISSKCSVPENCVKKCILYTCEDMSKMYKRRYLNRKNVSESVETNKTD